MRTLSFLIISCIMFFFGCSRVYQEEKYIPAERIRVEKIEIHVLSKRVNATLKNGEILEFFGFDAATSSPKNAHEIPYGKIGKIHKIVLNPSWSPPESIREEYEMKGKDLPGVVPPGKNNPLGRIKLFIAFDGHNSSFGIHHTDNPKSIGKRVTHGCTRMREADIFWIARFILEKNSYDADVLFERARTNPRKSIVINIDDGPSVVHLKD